MRARLVIAAVSAGGALLLAPAAGAPAERAGASASAPLMRELVAFRDGTLLDRELRARAATARVRGRSCAVPAGTALAALLLSRPGRVRLRDFGSCSDRARDAAGLFVSGIRSDLNRGRNGWVYKVNRRLATAGAADPAGPFGRGRLRSGATVTWFYCRLERASCQPTLLARTLIEGDGRLRVTVTAYDDEGRGSAVEGASVAAGAASTRTDAAGAARLSLPPGDHRVTAEKQGLVPAPPVEVRIP
jgi:hypothetical protein